jgi:hypothetical protein
MKLAKKLFIVGAMGLLAFSQAQAAPTILTFRGITGNDTSGNAVADGAANLKAEVIDLGAQGAGFRFTNDSDSSSLTDVYFDDGALLAISRITSSGGVSFAQGASPPNLPGGNSIAPAFATTVGFLADSNSPVSHNGVQNTDTTGEWLQIDFSLKSGKTFADVLTALTLPAGDDWLRVGLHVQAFEGGYSESFINLPVMAVPEPETYVLMLAGLGLLGVGARRRRAR